MFSRNIAIVTKAGYRPLYRRIFPAPQWPNDIGSWGSLLHVNLSLPVCMRLSLSLIQSKNKRVVDRGLFGTVNAHLSVFFGTCTKSPYKWVTRDPFPKWNQYPPVLSALLYLAIQSGTCLG